MPNSNAPNGFLAVRQAKGGTIRTGQGYAIAAGLGNSLFTGDFVYETGTAKQVDVISAAHRILGAFDGCQFLNSFGEVKFSPYYPGSQPVLAGSTLQCWVYDDTDLVFMAQMSGAFANTDVGALADVTVATAGNVFTGRSGQQIDSTTLTSAPTSGAGTQVRIESLASSLAGGVSQNAYGANAKVLCRISKAYLSSALFAAG